MDVWRAAFAVPECLVWFVGHAAIHAHRPVHIADSGLDARLHRIVLLAAAKARQMLFIQRQRLVDLASTHRIPAMWNAREFVEIGGLIMYGASIYDLSRRAAVYVDRILKGSKPSELPIDQPTKFELVVNMTTAKTLGMTIPPSLLARADAVIE